MICFVLRTPNEINLSLQHEETFVLKNPPAFSRQLSCCAYSVADKSARILLIPDTLCDRRSKYLPTVLMPHGVRAYCGVPIRISGATVGVMCVMDHVPRYDFNETRARLLANFADLVAALLARCKPSQKMLHLDAHPTFLLEEDDQNSGEWLVVYMNKEGKKILGFVEGWWDGRRGSVFLSYHRRSEFSFFSSFDYHGDGIM